MGETRFPILAFMHDAAGTSHTTAWKTITTNLSSDIYAAEFFYSGGEVVEIGYGSGSVTPVNYYVIPGGPSGRIGFHLNQGMTVSFRNTNSTVTSGVFVANFLR